MSILDNNRIIMIPNDVNRSDSLDLRSFESSDLIEYLHNKFEAWKKEEDDQRKARMQFAFLLIKLDVQLDVERLDQEIEQNDQIIFSGTYKDCYCIVAVPRKKPDKYCSERILFDTLDFDVFDVSEIYVYTKLEPCEDCARALIDLAGKRKVSYACVEYETDFGDPLKKDKAEAILTNFNKLFQK